MKAAIYTLCVATIAASAPLALDSRNPHYFEYQGKPTVLVTSGEHYGALINLDFDYVRYLDELQRSGLNLTRIWTGSYRETLGNFKIGNNTLAPRRDRFISPWIRSGNPGALDGGNRFDLKQWNSAYFERLHDFLTQASRRGIVVEINLFCTFYEDSMWNTSPLNPANNVNQLGLVPRSEALSLKHIDLVAAEDEFARKIVTEVNAFDNVYFEICNEPYVGKVSADWQRHISTVIVEAEKRLPQRHLISQNVANGSEKIANPDPNVSIFNFHYSRPPESVAVNYRLNRAIGNNETGFDGQSDSTYRIQGWSFLAAGGALYNNLDYSFAVAHESGDYPVDKDTPGGGSRELRRQLGVLNRFFQSLELAELRPAGELAALESEAGDPGSTKLCALAAPGKAYVSYLYRAAIARASGRRFEIDPTTATSKISLDLPPGNYRAVWTEPKTGAVQLAFRFHQRGERRVLESPPYKEDIVLSVLRD